MRGCLGLDAKTGQVARCRQLAAQDHLERHHPLQAALPGFVDDAHAALAQLLQ